HDHGHDIESVPGGASAPELPPDVRGRFRLYALGLAAVKIGIESINLVVPLLLISQLNSAALVGVLFVAADLAGMGGSLLGGWLSDRLRPSRLMMLTTLGQAAAVAAMILLSGGAYAVPAVLALFTLNGALSEVFGVARRAALPVLVGRDEGTLRVYNGRAYLWRELAATGGVLVIGWLAQNWGFAPALWLHPAFYLAAAFLFLRLAAGAGAPLAAAAAAPRAPWKGLRAASVELFRGARIVWKDPKLRLGLFVNGPVLATHKLFHALVGTLFAAKVLGNPAYAALILGAWNLGELGAAWALDRRGHAISTSAWLRFAAAAGLASWAFWLLPTLWAAVAVACLMGVATLASELVLNSFFQSAAPERDQGVVNGFVYALGTAASMAALLVISVFFDLAGASTGFFVLALAFTVISGLYLHAASALKK
ncbi:MAG TPA: MFS transporter, partial [Elusimicrobiota bacterium]|nr:MFS transporter [Elusimicrobiota bacterium]